MDLLLFCRRNCNIVSAIFFITCWFITYRTECWNDLFDHFNDIFVIVIACTSKLSKLTKILAIIFVVITLLVYILQ